MVMRERRRERFHLQVNHPRSVPTPESPLSPGSAPSGRRQDGSPWSPDWTRPTSPVAPSVCSSPAWAPLSQLANCGCTSLLGHSVWGGGSHCCICFAKCNRTKQTERGLCHKWCCLHALSVVGPAPASQQCPQQQTLLQRGGQAWLGRPGCRRQRQ